MYAPVAVRPKGHRHRRARPAQPNRGIAPFGKEAIMAHTLFAPSTTVQSTTSQNTTGTSRRPVDRLAVLLPTLRDMLEEQRDFRLEQLAELSEPVSMGAVSEIDPTDDAAENTRREVAECLVAGARRALADIEAGLARMADGRFGACATCRAGIPVERLEIIPQAALCVTCQRDGEVGG